MEIQDIIKDVPVITEDTTFREAVSVMVREQTNSLLVVDEAGKLSGEVSVSDLMDAIVPEYLDGDSIAAHFATATMFEEAIQDATDKGVSDFMTTEVFPVELDAGMMSVAATAIANQRARIPVVDEEGHPVGIISRRGLKHLIAEQLGISDSA
jgi:CBS domain-containing protein